jgi:predicted nuclease of restriction endonuclease-like (RecB) superfamily
MAKRKQKGNELVPVAGADYDGLLVGLSALLDQSRRSAARAVNAVLTATYWEVGRRIVEFEQGGRERAGYGEALMAKLAADLSGRYGRGFSRRNLEQMRVFYLDWEMQPAGTGALQVRMKGGPVEKAQTPSAELTAAEPGHVTAALFPLPWSHYVRLMTVPNPAARRFYEEEAVKGGWSVRQLDRQIGTQFFERLRGSYRKDVLLAKAHTTTPADAVTADELVRDPYVLEFLNLKNEYGEGELEEAIVRHLEAFLLELGRGFTFVSRQQKVRIDAEWYKIGLLLFHRRLRCLVVIDLKIGKFTHADAGQMNLYLNYAREHLSEPGENPPVGLILCSQKSDTVVRYAMGGINAQVFASKYLTDLPAEEELRAEVERTKRALAGRAGDSPG